MADDDLLETNAITWSPVDTDPRILQDMQRNIQHRNIQLHNDDPSHYQNRHPNNYDPYVHKELRSFSNNRFTKQINTTVLIDSRDRDTTKYPFPNNFTIGLGKQFEYLESIELTSVDIDNTTPPVNQYNNCIQWTYPRECDVEPDGSLVPTLTNDQLPSTFFASEKVCFKACIPIGFYTVNEIRKALMDYMNVILHTMCDTGLADLEDVVHSFHVDINVSTHEVEFVNRINIQDPVLIQTFLTTDDDVLRPFGGSCAADPNAFYLTIPDNGAPHLWKGDAGVIGDLSLVSLLPVVLTHLPTIGGISEQLINYVEYWDRYISTDITDFPYYEFCDEITIGTKTFSRYKFVPKNSAGSDLMAAYSQTVLLSPSLAPFLNALVANAADFATPFTTLNTSNLLNNESDVSNYLIPQGGCALPFKFNVVPDPAANSCNFNGVCMPREVSILESLGWPAQNNDEFAFIQNNGGPDGQIPARLISWERNSVGDYVLRSEPYVLMKLIVPGYTTDETGGNMVKTKSLNVQDSNSNIGYFIEPVRDFNDRSVRNLFAKIRLNDTQPNRSLFFSTSILKFYDRPLRQLSEFTVQLVDRHGQLANIRTDWNFTLEIIELQDQLSETNIDTRNGSHSLTGIRDINHHY